LAPEVMLRVTLAGAADDALTRRGAHAAGERMASEAKTMVWLRAVCARGAG